MKEHNKGAELLRSLDIPSRVTGIGSVPFQDPEQAAELILHYCPLVPYVPQLTKRDFRENMFLQFHENLPCLGVDHEKKQVFFDESIDKEKALGEFYDYVAHDCIEYFEITPDYSKGLYTILEKCTTRRNPFVKTQVTGPITYLLSLARGDKRPLIYDEEVTEAMTLGLAMKCLWQSRKIRKAGKTPLVFFDEPSLWGLGSAYMPLSAERVGFLIGFLINFIREHDAEILIGLHCCGNTDWSMVFESKVDIVSFDAYGFGDKVTLYPREILKFFNRGGFLAFGIVPTSEYRDGMTEESLYDRFVSILAGFEERGLARDLLLRNSLITPASGMGPLGEESAKRILELTLSLARKIEDQDGRA
jgi:hypothetical protein